MAQSPGHSIILHSSTLAHLANGLFEGRLSRLYDEPSNMSDIAHGTILKRLLDEKSSEALGVLAKTTPHVGSELAFTLPGEPERLNDLIQMLRQEGLEEYARAVREARLGENREGAIDWFSRQPTIVEGVLSLRNIQPDGSFSINWSSLYSVLSRSISLSKVEWLKELFEDCGYHYFNKDIEDLERWHLPSFPNA